MYNLTHGYSFDDVLLIPQKSFLASRDDVEIGTKLGKNELSVPIVSSPMDTVTEGPMASFMASKGGMGIIHRYMTIERQVEELLYVKKEGKCVGAAIGSNGDALDRAKNLIQAGADLLVLDVAHGHTIQCLNTLEKLRAEFPDADLCSGNIATIQAAVDCRNAGANILRVGIGGGSSCTTREVAGVGIPQLTAVQEIGAIGFANEISIISDGGIKKSSDIVKALAAGADAVMIGGLFASYDVAAGEQFYTPTSENAMLPGVGGLVDVGTRYKRQKKFRGMASQGALSDFKGMDKFVVEGEEFNVDIDYDFEPKFDKLIDGIRTGFAYLGAENLLQMQSHAKFVAVSPLGFGENQAHYGG